MSHPRARRWAGAVVLAGLLAACNAPLDSGVAQGPVYRDTDVPIGVTSRYDPARFAGLWQVRAVLPRAEAFDQFTYRQTPRGPVMGIAAEVCTPSGPCALAAQNLPTRQLGPGRYVLGMPDGTQRRLWVLWVDEGFRTAVVGNPEGSFAWILDRARTGGADRIAAAREILDFNGYDTDQLEVVQ